MNDCVDKIIYPLKMDDEFDQGKVNEYKSQIEPFQGSLRHLN